MAAGTCLATLLACADLGGLATNGPDSGDGGQDAPQDDAEGRDVAVQDAPADAPEYDGGLAYAAEVLKDGPIAYYRFEETVGATTLVDSSGHGRDGNVEGLLTLGSQGIAGSAAIRFGGAGDIETGVATAFVPRQPYTLECWVYLDGPQVNLFPRLLSNETLSPRAGTDVLMLAHADGGVRAINFERWLDGGGTAAGGTSGLRPMEFVHLVARFDGSSSAVFANGTGVAFSPSQGDVSDTGNQFRVGGAISGGAFVGIIDEVAFYDYALSDARVAAHYAAGK